ncbi:MAG: hypothetical protein HFF77_02880 [Oscillospiraceae bacterium]|jgi:hypothetical protein|nr:hypothetical protein [Oscillospiraceae bacterium]
MSYLLAKDTVNGAEGTIVITVDGKNYEVACMKNIKTTASIQSQDMRVIGTRKIQAKPNGAKLTGSGNIYYGSNIFTDMVLEYINTGKMTQFDIQITNSDPTVSVGEQAMAYYGCTLTGDIPISILDDQEAMLNYDFNFSYTDVARLQAFRDPERLGN